MCSSDLRNVSGGWGGALSIFGEACSVTGGDWGFHALAFRVNSAATDGGAIAFSGADEDADELTALLAAARFANNHDLAAPYAPNEVELGCPIP